MLNSSVEILILFVFLFGALLLMFMMLTEMLNFIQTRVPFVPTAKKDIQDLVNRVGITETDFVFDLGSGNGKVLFIVEQLTRARTRGLQRAGWTQIYARIKKLLTHSKTEFISGNFFNSSWSDATIVYGYLYPFLMSQVGEKAKRDCKPGTKIVVRDFPIPNLKLHQSWETPTFHKMFLYIIE